MRTVALTLALIGISVIGAGCGKDQGKKSEPGSSAAHPVAQSVAEPMPPSEPAQLPRTESLHLAQGTVIQVRILEALDSARPNRTQFVRASIAEDVKGADSQLAIPAGASALVLPLIFSKSGEVSQIGLSLYSVDLAGHQYHLTGELRNPAIALVSVDSTRNPENKTAHVTEGTILGFTLPKPAELR